MFKEVKMIAIVCDNCYKQFEDFEGQTVFEDCDEAMESMALTKKPEWWPDGYGHHYCRKCKKEAQNTV